MGTPRHMLPQMILCGFLMRYTAASEMNFANQGRSDLSNLTCPSDATVLILSDNPLGMIPAGIFQNLTGLTSLALARTQLVDNSMKRESFLRLGSINKLDLTENKLTLIPDLYHLVNLVYLHLNGNQLIRIDAYHFRRNPALIQLDMRWNKLESIHQDAFCGVRSLFRLYADGNQFQNTPNVTVVSESLGLLYLSGPDLSDFNEVYSDFSETFPEIKWLDIQNSELTVLPNITTAYNLIRLNLIGNRIRILPNISALGFPEGNVLTDLMLGLNEINYPVDPEVWTGFPNLEHLDLRNARISLWPDLRNATKLKRLYLQGTNIVEIPNLRNLGLPAGNVLEELLVNDNPLVKIPSSDTLTEFHSLKMLEIAACGVTMFPFPGEFILDNLPALTSLSIQGNAIRIIPDLSRVAALHTAKPLRIDARGLRLDCKSIAICWLLFKTFSDSDLVVTLDDAPCLDPLEGVAWSSLTLNDVNCHGEILTNAVMFHKLDSSHLHNGYSDIVTFRNDTSPTYRCLSYCLMKKLCRGVEVKSDLFTGQVLCAIHYHIPSNGNYGNSTGWQLYITNRN